MLMAACVAVAATSADATENLLPADAGGLVRWHDQGFHGQTRYRPDRIEGVPCVRADSHASASGLFRKVHIDLERTPMLEWSWWVPEPLEHATERTRSGDDFAARIYLIISGGLFFWNTRAINYVWAAHEPPEALWPNPFTENSAMLAVESGPAHAGQWRHYRRNIRKDLQRYFGRDFHRIDAVAIMTDTDNTGARASACYGPIRFTARNGD